MSFLLSPARRTISSTLPSTARAFSSTPRAHLARMTLVGRLGTEPETSTTNNGQTIVKHVLGTSHGPKDDRQTSWFRITSFIKDGQDSRREFLEGLQKGTLVYVEGDATMRTYQDREGKTASALNIVQTKIDVLKRPQNQEAGDGTSADV